MVFRNTGHPDALLPKTPKYGHEGQTLTREIGGVKLKTMETGTHESPNTQFERANSWALEFSSQPLSRGELARRAELILGHGPKGKTGEGTEWPLEDISAIEDRRANWEWRQPFAFGQTELIHGDCFDWLQQMEDNSIHAVVTDPPYGLEEYTEKEQIKLRKGRGGIWRLPPSYDGNQRSPIPRFTVLTDDQLQKLHDFFFTWARYLLPKLRPGANVLIASNPLLAHIVNSAVTRAGFEKRGEIIRLVTTMRGGDRPKGAHQEFKNVTVMPRSMWEPWITLRKPLDGTVQENLRRWETGGFRRPSDETPFGDVIKSAPTKKRERTIAPHPSLKPQAFLREIVRGVLPLGEGTVIDTFAGAGSTLAAAEAVGYRSKGIERDPVYFDMATSAIEQLSNLETKTQQK